VGLTNGLILFHAPHAPPANICKHLQTNGEREGGGFLLNIDSFMYFVLNFSLSFYLNISLNHYLFPIPSYSPTFIIQTSGC